MFVYSTLEDITSVFQVIPRSQYIQSFTECELLSSFYRTFRSISTLGTFWASFDKSSDNYMAFVFICLGPCFSYANKTDFMIIATKTRIRVMYAAKSSKSNSSSSGLGAVEFMAYRSHKSCIFEGEVQLFFFSFKTYCWNASLIDSWVVIFPRSATGEINKVYISSLSPNRICPFRFCTVMAHCSNVSLKFFTFKQQVTVKNISCSVSVGFI